MQIQSIISPGHQNRIDWISKMAKAHAWNLIDLQAKNMMISFERDKVRVNVYYSTMTVGTCMEHPTKGKTQLFRKNITSHELEKIFKNPRVHTDKGYYTSKPTQKKLI